MLRSNRPFQDAEMIGLRSRKLNSPITFIWLASLQYDKVGVADGTLKLE